MAAMDTETVIEELAAARDDFHATLAAVAPESRTTPGLIGEWSGRDLVAHLGYWAGHAVDTIHAVEEGRAEDVGIDDPPVDEVNETVVRVARGTPPATVLKREAASVEALVERLRRLDASLLAARLPDGQTLLEAVREDGAGHYRDHAEELRRALGEKPHG
jgi:hypothetical protein